MRCRGPLHLARNFFLGLDNSPPTQGGAWALVFGYILLIDSYLNPPVLNDEASPDKASLDMAWSERSSGSL